MNPLFRCFAFTLLAACAPTAATPRANGTTSTPPPPSTSTGATTDAAPPVAANTAQPTGTGAAPSTPPARRGRACTEMACTDQVTATRSLTAAEAAPGTHVFVIEADGFKTTCKLTVAKAGERADTSCERGILVRLGPKMEGVELTGAPRGMVAHGERPIPGQFEWQVVTSDAPKSLRVQHSLNNKLLVDRVVVPTYQTTRPNGPDCEPACQTANATVP